MSPKDYSYVQPVIKEAILKEQKEPKMAKDEAKKEEILNRKEPQKAKAKYIKEERFRKEAKKAQTLGYFLYFGKIAIYVRTCKDCR